MLAVFPIYWMAITAFKQDPDLYRMDAIPFWFHLPPTWKNFDFLFHSTSYGDWIVNTMTISFWVSVDHAADRGAGGLRAGPPAAAGRREPRDRASS